MSWKAICGAPLPAVVYRGISRIHGSTILVVWVISSSSTIDRLSCGWRKPKGTRVTRVTKVTRVTNDSFVTLVTLVTLVTFVTFGLYGIILGPAGSFSSRYRVNS